MKHLIAEFDLMRRRYPPGSESSLVLPCLHRIQQDRGFVADSDIAELTDYIGVPRGMRFVPGNYRGIQLLHFSPRTEIVSNVDGKRLLLNKNGDSAIMHVYMAESEKAGVVRYR